MQKDNIKESNKMKKNSRIALKKRAYSISDNWRGNPNIKVKYYNEWADPDLLYDDYVFNYWDIEDALWEDFLEYNELDESDAYDGYDIKPEYEEMFDKHVQDFGHSYLDELIWSGAPKTWHTSKKAKRKKASSDWAIFIGAVPAPVCGKWVSLPCDDSEIDEAIEYAFAEYEKYNGEKCDEYMIADYEGPFGLSARDMEWEDPHKLNEAVTELSDSYLPDEVIAGVIDYYGIFDAAKYVDDVDYIEADSESDLAHNYIEEVLGSIEALGRDTLERYFDYEAFGRELAWDFDAADGYYFRCAKKQGKFRAWGIKKKAGVSEDRVREIMENAENECVSYQDVIDAQDYLGELRDKGMQYSDEYFELANAVFGCDPFDIEGSIKAYRKRARKK